MKKIVTLIFLLVTAANAEATGTPGARPTKEGQTLAACNKAAATFRRSLPSDFFAGAECTFVVAVATGATELRLTLTPNEGWDYYSDRYSAKKQYILGLYPGWEKALAPFNLGFVPPICVLRPNGCDPT
jgi:hypothetical protein